LDRSEANSAAQLLTAYRQAEAEVRLTTTRIGAILVALLVPGGFVLDWFVYRDHFWRFLVLRLVCGALSAGLYFLTFSRRSVLPQAQISFAVALLPVASIAWMIYATEGFASPYYAGLNIVLLGIGSVFNWTVLESWVAVAVGLAMYLLACLAHQAVPYTTGQVVNNLFFIALMDLMVVVGTAYRQKQRRREFELRHQLNQSKAVLERSNAELDRSRAELEAGNRKLTELNEVKSRFFANISHELRTPLTLLLAPLDALRNPRARLPDEQVREHLRTMHTNGLRLLKLINDLLDLVRLDSGRMKVRRQAVSVTDFLAGIVQSTRQLATDRKLRLELELQDNLGVLALDRDKTEKSVLNLLVNAIKFTGAGGTVTCAARQEAGRLRITVRDTGVGIRESDLPRVFDRFWQADTSSQRKHQGTGIGLALVKELMEIQDGTVTVDSRYGQGTTFTLDLPALDPATTPLASEEDEAPTVPAANLPPEVTTAVLDQLYRRADLAPALTSLRESIRPVETGVRGQKPKVLLADDEPDMLRFLRSQLEEHFQVIEAVDGLQAIQKAAQFLPDVILCDMMMPERDGLAVCRELRARTSTQNLPFVMLTARADEETKIAALFAGADDFLTKPFSTTELHVRLKNLVESHRLQRELGRQKQALEQTIEELKETELQLVQSEKMASLGRLSAGIIHEINNPLNFAKTGLYALKRSGQRLPEADRDDFKDILKDIDEGIERVSRIVGDLRSFSHPHAGASVNEVDAAHAVESALRFLAAEWREQVAVENQVPAGFTVIASREKLIQVLVNLMQNALDALKTKEYAAGGPVLRLMAEALPSGGRRLVIWDNGPGIAAVNRDKIFDPFFTTKEVGKGTGLGLSICYRLVNDWGGSISLRTEEGQFCQFTLEFAPAAPAPTTPPTAAQP
jgi:signal transduction histidine kinase